MSVRIFIPARMNSQRLPNKPLKLIGNQTLIEHVYNQAIQTNFPVTVLTDTNEIKDKFTNWDVVITEDCLSGTDRVSLVTNKYNEKYFVNCQGDLPFIAPHNILQSLLALDHGDIGTLVAPLEESKLKDPNTVKAITTDLNEQFCRINWCGRGFNYGYHHIGVYAFERKQFNNWPKIRSKAEEKENLEQLRWLENNLTIAAFKIKNIPIEVNTEEDLIIANMVKI